jgi:hypothetical protein
MGDVMIDAQTVRRSIERAVVPAVERGIGRHLRRERGAQFVESRVGLQVHHAALGSCASGATRGPPLRTSTSAIATSTAPAKSAGPSFSP